MLLGKIQDKSRAGGLSVSQKREGGAEEEEEEEEEHIHKVKQGQEEIDRRGRRRWKGVTEMSGRS